MAAFDDVALLTMLKGRMTYLNQRQKVISENVANADTPGYMAKDMMSFDKVLAAQPNVAPQGMLRTDPRHMDAPANSTATVGMVDAPDSETRLDGNSVVLEEQMMKMAEARSDYDTAVTLYEQAMNMIRIAAKRPGS